MVAKNENGERLIGQRNEHQLATTAMLYYKESLTQNEIAKRLGVSRATVVNYLRLAREQGIVDISIAGSSFASSKLAKDIKSHFQLEDVYIASLHDGPGSRAEGDEEFAMRQVARVAAMALCEIVSSDDMLGVAWGKTIQFLAEELPTLNKKGLSVYQMIGSMKSPLMVAAETCAINIAKRFGADCYTMPAPAILSTPELAITLRAEPIIKMQLEQIGKVNKILFSVGSCMPRTHLVQSDIATLDDLQWYVDNGAVGVVCGRFIDKNGNHVIGPLDKRMIGVEPAQLRAVETGVTVVAGQHKLEATLAAIRGGYTTHLILDERSGVELLAVAQANAE